MRRFLRLAFTWPLAVVGCLLLGACGGGGTSSDSPTNPTSPTPTPTQTLPATQVMTAMPVDPAAVTFMSPYGENGHNGLDFHTSTGGRFFSVGEGVVTAVDLNTGLGLPGTTYRIMLEYTSTGTGAEYGFELDGTVSDQVQRDNILVAVGDRVTAGQHIGNLASQGDDAHVHFQIHEQPAGVVRCPLEYFSPDVATQLENLYDSSLEKRSPLPDLCN